MTGIAKHRAIPAVCSSVASFFRAFHNSSSSCLCMAPTTVRSSPLGRASNQPIFAARKRKGMAVSHIESCFHLSLFAFLMNPSAKCCKMMLMCNLFLQVQASDSKAMHCSLGGSDGSGTNGAKSRSETTKANLAYLNSHLDNSPSRDPFSLQHKVNLQSFPSHYVAIWRICALARLCMSRMRCLKATGAYSIGLMPSQSRC